MEGFGARYAHPQETSAHLCFRTRLPPGGLPT